MLEAGARVMRNEEHLEDHDGDIGLNRWGHQMDGWGDQSTSTASTVSVEENYGQIQWLQNTTVREYVHQEGSDHQYYVWRRQQSRQEDYP